jgi:hypothetical protein
MSQDNVKIVRKAAKAFLENDFEGWFATMAPDCKLYPRPEEPEVKECYEGWDEMLDYLVNRYSGCLRRLLITSPTLPRGRRTGQELSQRTRIPSSFPRPASADSAIRWSRLAVT